MKKNIVKKLALTGAGALAGAAVIGMLVSAGGRMGQGQQPPQGQFPETDAAEGFAGKGSFPGIAPQVTLQSVESPSEIVTSDVPNSAVLLEADTENAKTIEMTESGGDVKIGEPGTYIITGSCGSGSITVKKETEGVVLILRDLDLTSSSGAALSLNKGSEVKVIIEGTVKLTDAENPADEYSSDAETADAYDGAAVKVKARADAAITGEGTLIIDASGVKNGIKTSGDEPSQLVIDGPEVVITAANDGINAGYDLTVTGGSITVTAGDDGIHADRILTLGNGDGTGPEITIEKSSEGLEGTVVNIFGGSIEVNASDDGINAADSDGVFADEMSFSVNITGGTIQVDCGGDGLDSNGNINLTGGSVTIKSASNGGEAGIDCDGSFYLSDSVQLDNASGITGGMMGHGGMPQNGMQQGQGSEIPQNGMQRNGGRRGMNGRMPGMDGTQPEMNGRMPGMDGTRPEMNGRPSNEEGRNMPEDLPGENG